jgi:flavin reductase (DIM6/NTAB) family NADH-FMN oxidoreductase RutF
MMQVSLTTRPSEGQCAIAPPPDHLEPVAAADFRLAMRNLASGVAIVATGTGNARQGSTVSSVTSICLEPPSLLVSVNTASRTHAAILAEGRFGVSLLRKGQESLVQLFAGQDDIFGADRFQTASWGCGITGAPLLVAALCAIDCVLYRHEIIGSHGLFIGRIVETRLGTGDPILNFQGKLRTLPQL